MDQNPQLILPIEAQNRFARAADENQKLKLLLESQKMILDDLEMNRLDEDKLIESINEVNKEIETVTDVTKREQAVLLDLLRSKNDPKNRESASAILKIILENTQNLIFDILNNIVEDGKTNATLMIVYELEQKITRIIDSLKERGVYPETEAMAKVALEEMQAHQHKIHVFVNEILEKSKSMQNQD